MPVLQTSRELKPVIQDNRKNIKLLFLFAESKRSAVDILVELKHNPFDTYYEAIDYLRAHQVKVIDLGIPDEEPCYIDGKLRIMINFPNREDFFNLAILVVEAIGKVYIFDVKDLDTNKIMESDGFEYVHMM